MSSSIDTLDERGKRRLFLVYHPPFRRKDDLFYLSLAEFIVMNNLFHLGELIWRSCVPSSVTAFVV